MSLYETPCGQDCKECSFFENECKGCMNKEGKPFWAEQAKLEICPIYDCASNKKDLEHCGNCEDYPCKKYLELRDPSMSDEEWNKSVNDRRENLMKRKNIN